MSSGSVDAFGLMVSLALAVSPTLAISPTLAVSPTLAGSLFSVPVFMLHETIDMPISNGAITAIIFFILITISSKEQ